MKKKIKIFHIVLIASLVLPIIAYKIKAPRFITAKELQIAQFQEPSLAEIKEKRALVDIVLSDPFRLEKKQSFTITEKPREVLPTIQLSLIYSGKNKYVMIGDRIFKEGDRFDGFIIARISHDRVLLKDKKGEEIWLKL